MDVRRQLAVPGRSATARFAYDGTDAIAEYNGSNALQRRFVFGPGGDEPLVWYEGTGTSDRRFMEADERGSVIALSDSSGTPIAINTYDEYGVPGSGNIGRFQYTGQKWIGEAALYDYKARDYVPKLGIFAQTDPIGYAGDGPNLYAYVTGDPVNLVDPLGLNMVTVGSDSCGPGTGWSTATQSCQPEGPPIIVTANLQRPYPADYRTGGARLRPAIMCAGWVSGRWGNAPARR